MKYLGFQVPEATEQANMALAAAGNWVSENFFPIVVTSIVLGLLWYYFKARQINRQFASRERDSCGPGCICAGENRLRAHQNVEFHIHHQTLPQPQTSPQPQIIYLQAPQPPPQYQGQQIEYLPAPQYQQESPRHLPARQVRNLPSREASHLQEQQWEYQPPPPSYFPGPEMDFEEPEPNYLPPPRRVRCLPAPQGRPQDEVRPGHAHKVPSERRSDRWRD